MVGGTHVSTRLTMQVDDNFDVELIRLYLSA